MLLRSHDLETFKIVNSPGDVLNAIKNFERELVRGEHIHMETTKGDFSI